MTPSRRALLAFSISIAATVAVGECWAQQPKPGATSNAAQRHLSDRELRRLLAKHVKGLAIDAKRIRIPIARPPSLAFSDPGPQHCKLHLPTHGNIADVVPHHLDVNAFGAALHDALKDNVVGYSAGLRRHGQTILTQNWQWAKMRDDGDAVWTPDVPLHVASVSKLITAMAMTELMIQKNISPDAQIIDYLPDYWVKGPNIQFITFRNLFNHTSGLTTPQEDLTFLDMKSAIAAGISLSLDPNVQLRLGKYNYRNVNFALCRVLLTVMNGNVSKHADFGFDNDLVWDNLAVAGYVQYVQNKVLRQAGVFGATLDHPDAAGLAYKFPVDSAGGGWNSGSLQRGAGADGWHISVNQVLDVMGECHRGRSIVSPESAQQMLDDGFGVDPPNPSVSMSSLLTPAGIVYAKPGSWYDTPDDNHHEEQSLALFLPEDMELVVLANSPVGNPPAQNFLCTVINVYLDHLTTQLVNHP